MSASKHTPGPWVVDPISDSTRFNLPLGTIYQVLSEAHKYPATVCTIEEYREIREPLDRASDAMLIAAAPDMLKSLQDLADAAQARENPMGDPCALLAAQANLRDATKRARSVIAKATGSEP